MTTAAQSEIEHHLAFLRHMFRQAEAIGSSALANSYAADIHDLTSARETLARLDAEATQGVAKLPRVA